MRVIRIKGLYGIITSFDSVNRKLDVSTAFIKYYGISFDEVDEITPLVLKKMK